MITPPEIERLRDLNSPQADALIDLCRQRVVVLSKAIEQDIPNVELTELVGYHFSDRLGYSGLSRGDIVRGEVWGRMGVDSGGPARTFSFQLYAAGQLCAQIAAVLADTGGDPFAFRLRYFIRLQGGEAVTLNSPAKGSSAGVYAGMELVVGDTFASADTLSYEAQSPQFVTVSNPVPHVINLSTPLSMSVSLETEVDASCTIYGGTMEGL